MCAGKEKIKSDLQLVERETKVVFSTYMQAHYKKKSNEYIVISTLLFCKFLWNKGLPRNMGLFYLEVELA